jgi:hypothetical protein
VPWAAPHRIGRPGGRALFAPAERFALSRQGRRLRDHAAGVFKPRGKVPHARFEPPIALGPGHAQVDFGKALAEIAGVERKIHFFAMDLPHSDTCFVQAYPAENAGAFCG